MMRKNQCLFCTSRAYYTRIVTPDLKFDEISCHQHSERLACHADEKLNGALRCNLSSTGKLTRGAPYPVAPAEGKV